MKIIVKINLKTLLLNIDRLETVYTIKAELSRKLNLNPDKIILRADNRELDDGVTLMDERIKHMSIINATILNEGGRTNIFLEII